MAMGSIRERSGAHHDHRAWRVTHAMQGDRAHPPAVLACTDHEELAIG